MKITKEQLKQVIKEELEGTLKEMSPPQASELPGPLGVASNLGRGLWWAILSHLEETVPDEDPSKQEMLAAVTAEAEKEEDHRGNPNSPDRMAEIKRKRKQ